MGNTGLVARVDAVLDGFARRNRVRVLMAVDAGSRAWGFPSPDSDHDVRFVFVRPVSDLLSVDPPKDTLETTREGLDFVGWDLRKALRLALDGKPAPLEWARSSVVHRSDDGFRERFADVLDRIADKDAVLASYVAQARKFAAQLAKDKDVPLKRTLHPVRHLAAAEWMTADPGAGLPPMVLTDLLPHVPWPDRTVAEIERLVAMKRAGSLGTALPSRGLVSFLSDRAEALDRTDRPARSAGRVPSPEAIAAADAFLLAELAAETMVGRVLPTPPTVLGGDADALER